MSWCAIDLARARAAWISIGCKAALLLGVLFFWPASLVAQQPSDSGNEPRFEYTGELFARGIFVWRDLPVGNAPIERDERRTPQSYDEYVRCSLAPQFCTSSRSHEQQDYYGLRLRLDAVFRASPNVEALFGIEVGEFTFGRESARSGPGSGGRGEGATNLETRQLVLRVHDEKDRRVLDFGVLPFSTPAGLVLARSGAGLRLFVDPQLAGLTVDSVYFKAVDNSQVDGDSNGFSDDNFSDIDILATRIKYSQLRWIRPELYGVFRNDGDASSEDPLQNDAETSRIYWAGLYAQLQYGLLEATVHGVGVWGRFERPLSRDPATLRVLSNPQDALRPALAEAIKAPIWKEYRVNGGAWQFELSLRLRDSLRLGIVSTGASGRPDEDLEPDGAAPAYRADQFRVAGASYQFTEIAIDDSGGYSLFAGGRLTGIAAEGLRLRYRPLERLELRLAYYHLRALHPVTLRYNANYNYLQLNRSVTFLGEESNLRLQYDIFRDLKAYATVAWFNAAAGYKALVDARYGDGVGEMQFGLTHEF